MQPEGYGAATYIFWAPGPYRIFVSPVSSLAVLQGPPLLSLDFCLHSALEWVFPGARASGLKGEVEHKREGNGNGNGKEMKEEIKVKLKVKGEDIGERNNKERDTEEDNETLLP